MRKVCDWRRSSRVARGVIPATVAAAALLFAPAAASGQLAETPGLVRVAATGAGSHATPALRAAKQRSRTAYSGLGARDARLLAEQAFPAVYRRRAWKADLANGGGRPTYAGDYGAVIETADGARSLVQSSMPLRARGDDERLAPVDTELVARDGGFAPRNGAVDLRIGDEVGEGTALLASGLTIRPITADPLATGAKLGPTVTWTDIDVDTDFSVTTTVTGVQTFHHLRSVRSPERLGLEVDLPKGAVLRRTRSGADELEVVRGEQVLAAIAPPSAVDAAGRPVAVRTEPTARGFTLAVDHRSADVTYPLLVDPVIIDQHDFSDSSIYFKGWDYTSAGPWLQLDWWYADHSKSPVRALHLRSLANYNYDYPWWGGWRFRPPGDSKVVEVDLPGMQFSGPGTGMCVEQGFVDAGITAWQTGHWIHPLDGQSGPAPWQTCSASFWNVRFRHVASPPRANVAFLSRLLASWSGYRTTSAYLLVPGAVVTMTDDTAPTSATLAGLGTTGWRKAPPSTVQATVQDGGLGVGTMQLRIDDQDVGQRATVCAAATIANPRTPDLQCPGTATRSLAVPAVANGVHTLAVTGRDVLDNQRTSAGQTLRIDAEAPSGLVVGGPFAADQDRRFEVPVRVDVSATDGDPASGASQRSGVASVELWVDERKADEQAMTGSQTVANSCTGDSCPIDTAGAVAPDRYLTFDPRRLKAGSHTVRVRVVDRAGNAAMSAPQTVTTVGDGLPPAVLFTTAPPDEWVHSDVFWVEGSATDALSGVQEVVFREPLADGTVREDRRIVDSWSTGTPCQGTTVQPCPPSEDLYYATATDDLREGYVDPTVEAIDASGLSSGEQPWRGVLGARLKVDRSRPTIVGGGDFEGYGPTGKVLTEPGTYELTVRVTDGSSASDEQRRSGVDSVDLELAEDIEFSKAPEFSTLEGDVRVTGPRVNPPCLPEPDSCPQERTFTFDAAALGEGLHAVRATARDELADEPGVDPDLHTASRTFLFYVDFAPPTFDTATVTHNPPLPAAGGWLRGGAQTVAASAADAGTGVGTFELMLPAAGGATTRVPFPRPRADGGVPCRVSDQHTDRCPSGVSAAGGPIGSYDIASLPEGADQTVELRAYDATPPNGRVAPAVAQWKVSVDRTLPTAPHTFVGTVDAAGHAAITWAESTDPTASNGTAGSGFSGYEVQYHLPGQDPSSAQLAEGLLEFSGAEEGQHIPITVTARDVAGNARVVTTSVTLELVDEDTDPVTRRFERAFTYDGSTQPGDFGPAGWPLCEPDDLGGSYCGENDGGDPELDALDAESSDPGDPKARAAPRRPLYGLSDQNILVDRDGRPGVNPYADARFKALGIKRVRRIVPWNIVTRAKAAAARESARIGHAVGPADCSLPACIALADLNAWMREIHAQGKLEPLISFGTNFAQVPRGGIPGSLPAPRPDTTYRNAVREFRTYYATLRDGNATAWPRLKLFTAWNEPEVIYTSPGELARIATGPKLAAAYFRQLAALCGDEGLGGSSGRCRVIAGDMTDDDRTKAYFAEYKKALKGYRPRIFGFHAYGCTSAAGDDRLADLARATASGDSRPDARIWVTEGGGRLHAHRGVPNPNVSLRPPEYVAAEAGAKQDLDYLLNECWKVSSRLSRIYVYQWAGDKDVDDADADLETEQDPLAQRPSFGFDAGLTDVYTPTAGGGAANRYESRLLYDTLFHATR